ncbi:MAG: HAD-IA family hydrolase [archaeon]|nr:HAD-IA family hydrolase [archaeon]
MKHFKRKRPVFIFDIGGVVIIWGNNDPIFKYVAKRYRVPFTEMRVVMNKILPELEAGKISCNQFVQRSLARFGKKLRSGDNPARLITIPFARGAKPRKGLIRIVRKLQKQGYEVNGFSNTNRVHASFMKQSGWTTTLFHRFFASCNLRVVKPNTSAYRKVLEQIGVTPSDVIFIDNTEKNVLGAKKAGIKNSIRFHSLVNLKTDIERAMQEYE